MYESSELKF